MSIVNLKCSNHDLTLGSTPILASGSQNVDSISVEFDETWDAYGTREALFWKSDEPNMVYRQIFENYASTAVIPANVLKEKGKVIFCLRGVNDDDIITTTIVTLDVVEGVATEGTDPSVDPSVYDEILKELQNIRLTCGEQIIEQNKKHAIEFWVGTQAEYDAFDPKPTDTLCIITDEKGSKELLEEATAALKESNTANALARMLFYDAFLTSGGAMANILTPYNLIPEISGNKKEVDLEYDTEYVISVAASGTRNDESGGKTQILKYGSFNVTLTKGDGESYHLEVRTNSWGNMKKNEDIQFSIGINNKLNIRNMIGSDGNAVASLYLMIRKATEVKNGLQLSMIG